VWCTVKLVDGILDKPATIGKPIHNTTAYILGMGPCYSSSCMPRGTGQAHAGAPGSVSRIRALAGPLTASR
jgi:hypothetical protein